MSIAGREIWRPERNAQYSTREVVYRMDGKGENITDASHSYIVKVHG